MRSWLKPWTGKSKSQGGPYAMACERLWRLTEDLAMRQDSLEAFLNEHVGFHGYRELFPEHSDVPSSCQGLMSFVISKIDSKWTLRTVEVDGLDVLDYSFEGFEDNEAREIAKAIVDLTYTVTVQNAALLGRDGRH
jgi:hypothetical protein